MIKKTVGGLESWNGVINMWTQEQCCERLVLNYEKVLKNALNFNVKPGKIPQISYENCDQIDSIKNVVSICTCRL